MADQIMALADATILKVKLQIVLRIKGRETENALD